VLLAPWGWSDTPPNKMANSKHQSPWGQSTDPDTADKSAVNAKMYCLTHHQCQINNVGSRHDLRNGPFLQELGLAHPLDDVLPILAGQQPSTPPNPCKAKTEKPMNNSFLEFGRIKVDYFHCSICRIIPR
jgi:hypothetical protein